MPLSTQKCSYTENVVTIYDRLHLLVTASLGDLLLENSPEISFRLTFVSTIELVCVANQFGLLSTIKVGKGLCGLKHNRKYKATTFELKRHEIAWTGGREMNTDKKGIKSRDILFKISITHAVAF
jgi:hypothetical protein